MTSSSEQLWKDACSVLQGMLNPDMYSRWFAPVKPVELKDDVLVLGVANEFSQIWLQDNFLPLVREAVNQSSKHPLQVRFAVTPGVKADHLDAKRARSEKPTAPARPPLDIKLNGRYTFDTFVVGPNNSFAHAAALAVAQSPAKAYNPLFVYGGVGLDKTHLMQAIGHGAGRSPRANRVCYITSEQFTNEYIQAVTTGTVVKFRKKYWQSDVLLIDDVQFLAGKERMQEEFFHTFNTLFDGHKQIVLSSDRPAPEIANLESRLISRFEWGLVTELPPPALETPWGHACGKSSWL